jgi:hypothetical protein
VSLSIDRPWVLLVWLEVSSMCTPTSIPIVCPDGEVLP